jgi:hypothetical protein
MKSFRYTFETHWPKPRNSFKLTNHLQRQMVVDGSVLFRSLTTGMLISLLPSNQIHFVKLNRQENARAANNLLSSIIHKCFPMAQENNCIDIAVFQCVTRREVFKAEGTFQQYQQRELTTEEVGADEILIALTLPHPSRTDSRNEMRCVLSQGCERKRHFQFSYTRQDKNRLCLTSIILK